MDNKIKFRFQPILTTVCPLLENKTKSSPKRHSQKLEVDEGFEDLLFQFKHLVLVELELLQGRQVVQATRFQTHDLVVVQVPVHKAQGCRQYPSSTHQIIACVRLGLTDCLLLRG